MIALSILGFLLIEFSMFMLIRNNCVARYRKWVLYESSSSVSECLRLYYRLPSYDHMMWQLWRFNWDDYLEESHNPSV